MTAVAALRARCEGATRLQRESARTKHRGKYQAQITLTGFSHLGFGVGDVIESIGITNAPELWRVVHVDGAGVLTAEPLPWLPALRYRARRWLGRAWRRARDWVGLGLVAWGCQGCGLDVSAALASCATDLQCDPSELCSAGVCSRRCEGPGTCPEGFGCYLTYRERQGDPRGYYATCAPEQDGLRECPAVGAGGDGGGL